MGWLRSLMQHVVRLFAGARCTACGQPRTSERPLVSGPGLYVCAPCSATALTRMDGEHPAAPPGRCSFCQKIAPTAVLNERRGHEICAACAARVQEIVGQASLEVDGPRA